MALLPFICANFDDYFVNRNRGRSLGKLLDLEDYYHPIVLRRHVSRPLHRRDDSSVVKSDKNTFEVRMDVQQFNPEELTVKTTDNNTIVVEGKHEEKEDEHGYISRHFVRKYILPKGHDTANVESSLSSDGILTITSRKRKLEENVREIPIILTGPTKKPLEETNNKENGIDEEPKEKKIKK